MEGRVLPAPKVYLYMSLSFYYCGPGSSCLFMYTLYCLILPFETNYSNFFNS